MQTMDFHGLRQRLAGLVDSRSEVPAELLAMQRQLAIKFVATLPQLFGSGLDRTTLWDKIGSALEVGIAQAPSGDIERFVELVLDTIQCDDAQAARSTRLISLLHEQANNPEEERVAFLAYIAKHRRPLLLFARAEWERYKADRAAGNDVSWWMDPVELASEEVFNDE